MFKQEFPLKISKYNLAWYKFLLLYWDFTDTPIKFKQLSLKTETV